MLTLQDGVRWAELVKSPSRQRGRACYAVTASGVRDYKPAEAERGAGAGAGTGAGAGGEVRTAVLAASAAGGASGIGVSHVNGAAVMVPVDGSGGVIKARRVGESAREGV